MDTGERTPVRKETNHHPISPGWALAGWHPLFCEHVQAHHSDPDTSVLTVRVPEGQRELYAKAFKGKIAPMSPIFWRRNSDVERGHYEISALDHSLPGFRELSFEAFDRFENLQGSVRRERVGSQSQDFLSRMRTEKRELLAALYIPGLERKLETVIQASYQNILKIGELEGAADRTLSDLRNCVASELHILQERARIEAMPTELSAEAVKLIAEFSNCDVVDLKEKLKQARQRALMGNFSVDVSKALMRKVAEGVARASVTAVERARKKVLLTDFLKELITTSGLQRHKTQAVLNNALEHSIQQGLETDDIKQKLLRLARWCLEDAARQLAKDREQLRLKENRNGLIAGNLSKKVRPNPKMRLQDRPKRTPQNRQITQKTHIFSSLPGSSSEATQGEPFNKSMAEKLAALKVNQKMG